MSKAELFTNLTNLVDVDPFALLGISVSADEKRIAKRYRQIAKQLHPDALTGSQGGNGIDQAIAAQVIARIVNPSYQKLKHDKSRQETLSAIRFKAKRLARTEKLVPTFSSAQKLSSVAEEEVELFYEQSLSCLAESQFQSLDNLYAQSLEIGQLNLIFLSRRLENLVIRSKRAGLMSAPVTPTAVAGVTGAFSASGGEQTSAFNQNPLTQENPETNYAKKHTTRAKTYLVQQNYEAAVQELREALKIAPQSPEIHSLIGQAYYKQKLTGMAKTHFRQALKLKPDHKVALKYGALLGISESSAPDRSTPQESETVPKKPWLGRLLKR